MEGVQGLCESTLHRKAVRVAEEDGAISVEVHVAIDGGVHVPTVGTGVQEAVAEYLERMAGVRPVAVDVIVDDVHAPAVG